MLADFHYFNDNNRINVNRKEVDVEITIYDHFICIDVENDQYIIPNDTIIGKTNSNEDGTKKEPEVDAYVCADGSNYEVVWL